MNRRVKFICHAAIIAAIYVVLTYFTQSFASGAIQVRISEALCVLPYFTPAAIPGVTVGCLLANLITGCEPLDIVFGTFATLIGVASAWMLKKYKWLVPLPSILSNMAIIPPILMWVYGAPESYPFLLLTIGIGEVLSIYVLGMILLSALEKRKKIFE